MDWRRLLHRDTLKNLRLAAKGLDLRQFLDRKTLALLHKAACTEIDPDSAVRDNEELLQRLAPRVGAFVESYYRFEVEGLEQVPKGPALLVSNHDGGTTALEILGMGAAYYLERGTEERIFGLMHDKLFELPYLGNILGQLGAIRAAHHTADEAFATGHKIFVAPGGNKEAFRPFAERHQVKFEGRKGWVRLALRHKVPIVPVVFIGGHETFFVLNDGSSAAHALGLKKRFRLDTLPVFLGLPWGVGVGPIFHLPLPSKCKARFLPALHLDEWTDADENDTGAVDEIYDAVTDAIQHELAEMAHERGLPVVG